MTRSVARLLALVILWPTSEPQVAGSVLTESDITSEHLLRRPVAVDGRDWLGLFITGDSSWIAPAAVAWVGHLAFDDSSFSLAVTPSSPVLLVADVPQVRVGAARTVARGATLHPSERTLELGLGPRAYTLELRGTDPLECDAEVSLTDGVVTQELYFPDYDLLSCDEPHFTVEWAGDLDGDGRLDLVTTFSQKYSYYPRRLYLSSASTDGKLVGLVAAFDAAAA